MSDSTSTIPTPAIQCTIRRHPRAKRFTLSVHPDGRVVLTMPRRAARRDAEIFLREKESWITRTLAAFADSHPVRSPAEARAHYMAHRERARRFITERLAHWAQIYEYRFGRISIRNQQTCWGSCTRRGNLNFNYQLLFLPPHLADYVVVHELCHLRELNHSARFWALVTKGIPDHEACRSELRAWRPGNMQKP